MEADRFQHLKYAEPEFKTESLAVLGEYNKNSANPVQQAERGAARHGLRPPHLQAHHHGLPERHTGHAQSVRLQPEVLRPLLPAGVHHHPGGGRREGPRPCAPWWTSTGASGSAAATTRIFRWSRRRTAPRTAKVDWPSRDAADRDRSAFKGPAYNDATQGYGGARRARQPGVLLELRSVPEAGGARSRRRTRYTRVRARKSIPALFEIRARVKKRGGHGLCARPDSGHREDVPGQAGGRRAAGYGAQASALRVGARAWTTATPSRRYPGAVTWR